MYDKVKLWVPRCRATPDISQFLDKAKEQTDRDTGEVCTLGSLEGLKVSVYMGGISIIGSLPKFLYQSNVYPLDRHSTSQFVEKLSDYLHLPIANAKVTGLEFGSVFVMKHSIASYISKLGDMPKLKKGYFNGTLYYQTKGKNPMKELVFYDKIAEAKEKKMTIPVGFEDVNLLRYEMRFNRKLARQLKLPAVTASTLSESDFYRLMVKRYQDSYFSITKLNQVKADMSNIKTPSDAYDVLVALLINQSEQTLITDFFEEMKETKVFKDRKNYTRLKKKIQEVVNKASVTTSDELIRELDDEIKNVGAYV